MSRYLDQQLQVRKKGLTCVQFKTKYVTIKLNGHSWFEGQIKGIQAAKVVPRP